MKANPTGRINSTENDNDKLAHHQENKPFAGFRFLLIVNLGWKPLFSLRTHVICI